jgi:YD repeat-containing protein
MKNTVFLSVIITICFLYSCKKDNNNPNSNSSSLPKTYTEDIRSSVIGNSVTTYNLNYDANNRLTSMSSMPAPPVLNFIYKYADKSLTLDMYEQNELSIHEIFWLNAASLIDSTFQYNNTDDSSSEKYFYNGNMQLIQQKNYDFYTSGSILNKTTNYTYDNSGNVITATDDQGNATTYIYYTDLPNTFSMGQTYLPNTANLVKSTTLTSGSYTETATHFYSFDSSKRLIKDSATTSVSDFIAIKSYTY